MTPRSPACATALVITSGSGVDNTCATVGAVRPQPVRRCVVVGNIVTRVPCAGHGRLSRKIGAQDRRNPRSVVLRLLGLRRCCSAQPEDDGALHHEVDDRRRALCDDERHRDPPRLAVPRRVEEVIDADLHGVGDGVERADRDEPCGARRRLKRPAPVDEVRGGGARDEADGLGEVDVQTRLRAARRRARSRRSRTGLR